MSSTLHLGLQWGGGGGGGGVGGGTDEKSTILKDISHKERGRYFPGDLVLYPGDREIC